jgi:hypothetical protein
MAITQAIASSFKQQIFQAIHNFNNPGGNTFYLALYTSGANLDSTTTIYTTSGEVSSVGTNYPAGGAALISSGVGLTGTTSFLDFSDLTFPNVTLTCRGCMIYNVSQGNKAVAVFNFGSDKTATDGDFTIIFPTADATSAVIRLT